MSTLTLSERGLALQLAQAGSKHSRSLARVASELNLTTIEAVDLAMVHAHPQKVLELARMGLRVKEILVVYDVIDNYSQITKGGGIKSPSLRQVADFATWFLGCDFDDDDLAEAIEIARRVSPYSSPDLSSELAYTLACGRSLKKNSIQDVEEIISRQFEELQAIREGRSDGLGSLDEGQGDIPD